MEWCRDGAADGFNIMPPVLAPVDPCIAEVVPLLQREGSSTPTTKASLAHRLWVGAIAPREGAPERDTSQDPGISWVAYATRSPNFLSAGADRVSPSPGASLNVIQPSAIRGGSSNNSACSGSRSGSVKDSTMRPAGVEATSGAWRKQSW